MSKTLKIKILTPTGLYLEDNVDFLNVRSEKYNLGILPEHAPLITTLAISVLKTKKDNETKSYAIGGGVMSITKEETIILVNSIESVGEIDKDRAIESKNRALERLKHRSDYPDLDVQRAELALARALNRLNLIDNKD